MKMYKLEDVNSGRIWEAESVKWAQRDLRGGIKNWEDGGPHVGNMLVLDFEYSDGMGSFYSFCSDKITEIVNWQGNIHFKTEGDKEYKLSFKI